VVSGRRRQGKSFLLQAFFQVLCFLDAAQRAQVQIDVVAFAAPEPGVSRRILSLGECTWGEVMGPGHLARKT
jgi:hypothetical protein